MTGKKDLAIERFNELLALAGSTKAIYRSRLIAGLFFVLYLSGEQIQARTEARRLLSLAKGSGIAYINLVRTLAVDRVTLTENAWHDDWCPAVTQTAQEIAGAAVDGEEVAAFLAWGDAQPAAAGEEQRSRSDTIFRYPQDHPSVAVRVGSIHAVKGETHTATLVLETFWHGHHLKALKPWLLGDHAGADGAGGQGPGQATARPTA